MMDFSLDRPPGGGTLKSMNVLNNHKRNQPKGFTVVELLIVIVIIAILAAISMAVYTNISQRAKNTAIINAASQSLKMIQAYIATNGTYPATGSACITVDSGCSTDRYSDTTLAANAIFDANMATVGSLPKSVPVEGARLFGLSYVYNPSNTVNGESRPAHLNYHLFGTSKTCGIPGVMWWTAESTYITSSTGNTAPDNNGKTLCRVSIPGPAA